MTSNPTQSGDGSDERLDRKLREALDETETAEARATPVPAHVAIEGYDMIRELHRGGQGVVYEAVQKSTKRKVAIKILLEGRFASSSARRRFQREITLVAGLKHPNIIAIFDSGETPDGHQFCVMDYVRGRSIRDYVRQNKLPLEDTLKLFASVCEAAHFANQKGVVHRDLKPSNILVDTDGVPRVLDFGLAKQLAGGTESLVSMTGQVMGTLQYMSPEQTRGNPDEIDARSDVYSLGVVLYELLTGTHPYPVKGDMLSVVKHITETEPEPPSKMWRGDSGVASRKSRRLRAGQCPIDNELQTILFKSLSKDRERRYQSADALRQDVSSYLQGDPIEAKRDSSLYVLRKSLRRHRTQIAVTVGVIVIVLAALYMGSKIGGPTESLLAPVGRITSLAVLPLENLSGDPEQEYFSDGMTGELITTLGKIKALTIISRMSVMQYKGTDKSPSEIARELNVDAIVEGTVTRFGDRVRITANLIRAATSEQLWGDSYDRDLRDVLAMQGALAQTIAREINITVTPAEKSRLASARAVEPEAYEAYLKGRYYWNKRTPEGLKKGLEHFQQAIELDPGYAQAYAGIGDSYAVMVGWKLVPPDEGYPRAKAAATKALEIDDTLAEAHALLAEIAYNYDWDFSAAERGFKKALQLNPGYATAHQWYAEYLAAMGRHGEAMAEIERAQELDPLSLIVNAVGGHICYFAREYDQAIHHCNKALQLDPNFGPAHFYLGRVYERKGMYVEAIAELQKARTLLGKTSFWPELAHAYAVSGRTKQARKMLDELQAFSEQAYVSSIDFALINMALGEKDKAFAWLEKAFEDRPFGLVYLKVDPRYDSLRSDPRFDDLLRRIGLRPTARAPTTGSTLAGRRIMLAVLPFENLGSPDDEYFADGISDEIRSRLAAVAKLGVISRSSAFQYKDTNKPNKQIGSELGVDYLIDGTIRWDKRGEGAGRVRITPELIRISDDMSLWSQSYNRVIEDIFEVQSDIAGQVIKQLQITLLEPERLAIEVIPTENADAYRAYLRGLDYAGRPDFLEEDYRLAIQMFERAVKLDPDFVLAHAALSKAHSAMHHFGYDRTQGRSAKAQAAVDRALELQPQLPEAHLALGYYHYWCCREYDRSLEALAIAKKDLPNDSRILAVVGYILRRQGRFEYALDNLKRAFELSPLNAELANNMAETYIQLRRYPEADRWHDRSISLAPDQVEAYLRMVEIHWLWHGDTERARAMLEEMPQKNTPYTIFDWFQQELFERNYRSALDRLSFTPGEFLEYQFWFIAKSQLAGLVFRLMGEPMRAREAYDSARIVLEKEIKKRPDDHRVRSSLGIVYAALGRREDAIREGKLGVELFPVSKDAMIGPYRVEDLAFIYTLVGEHDLALDTLEYLLSIPSRSMSVSMLRLDPRWDPLREHQRYKELVRRHGFGPESRPQSITTPRNEKIMLVVLPFKDMSPEPQEWFSDGMTEEMITRLGRLRPELLGVIARTSAMRYKKTDKPIDQIGRELGVAYVVEGGVRRSGDSVRINAQLIQVSDQTQLWGNSYTRALSDVFAIQAEVAEAVAQSLAVELLPQTETSQVDPPTASSEAHDAYLLGRHYWAQRTPESLYAAIDHFKRAVEFDPNYALAYSGLADTWGVLPFYVSGPYNKMHAEAKKAAELAISLDDSLAEAHVSTALIFGNRGDMETAIEHYRRAVEIDPNNATAHQWYGLTLATQGRYDEASVEYERAITLDPLSAVMHGDYGFGMLCARRFDKAVEQSSKALELQPDRYNAAGDLTWAHIGKGDHDAAATSFENFLTLLGQPRGRVTSFHRAYGISGLKSAMLGWLDLPQDHAGAHDMSLVVRAGWFAWCGESDKAFEWLVVGLEEQDLVISFIGVHPAFDNLRDDPRFEVILRKAGLSKIKGP